MSLARPLLWSVLVALPILAAGCGGIVTDSLREGDATCARPAGSPGGCQPVMSSDRYEQEREEIRENRKGSAP